MAKMSDKDREAVAKEFSGLTGKVKIINFTQTNECMYCSETRDLMTETAALSDKISLEVYDFVENKSEADKYMIDKIPATVIMSEDEDYGIRYFGIPAGYEYASIVNDIKMISAKESGLSAQTKEYLKELTEYVHLQVFVTPTCPYCPPMVSLAHQMAFESPHVRGDMVEATEFLHLGQKYNVRGVPRTIINETESVEGRVPEEMFLNQIKLALYKGRKSS